MSAPYVVWIDNAGDHTELPAATLHEALRKARLVRPHFTRRIRIVGDGYDAEQGPDGARETSDGLTERERDIVEAAGF